MRVGVLTSGGDAPGMNAAIRAVVRAAAEKDWETVGIRRGYAGLIEGDMKPLDERAVGGIIQQGGTVLGSARCARFKTTEGRTQALGRLRASGVDALVVIGGNGSRGELVATPLSEVAEKNKPLDLDLLPLARVLARRRRAARVVGRATHRTAEKGVLLK